MYRGKVHKRNRSKELTNVSFTLTRTYVLAKLTFFCFYSPICCKMRLNVCYVGGEKKKQSNIHMTRIQAILKKIIDAVNFSGFVKKS